MFNSKRDFLLPKRESISLSSTLKLECLILELCTRASKMRAYFDSGEETRATDFK